MVKVFALKHCLDRMREKSMMNMQKEREFAREFYCSGNISLEFHYIDIDDKEWERRIKERNRNVLAGRVNAYYVVDELRMKLNSTFEKPDRNEMDIWLQS